MIYVGSELAAVANRSAPESALVDHRGTRRAPADLEYRPSYSRISRAARAAYLDWLEGGRSNPRVGIGYVLLFFYGLERRVLHDAPRDEKAREDRPSILAEVVRLTDIYGSHRSFREQASRLRDLLVVQGEMLPRTSEDLMTEEVAEDDGDALPLLLRAAIGRVGRVEGTLTAAGARCELECGLRTPAVTLPRRVRGALSVSSHAPLRRGRYASQGRQAKDQNDLRPGKSFLPAVRQRDGRPA